MANRQERIGEIHYFLIRRDSQNRECCVVPSIGGQGGACNCCQSMVCLAVVDVWHMYMTTYSVSAALHGLQKQR
jgi:hypothetical protein